LLSIITAVYNQRAMNEICWEQLRENTSNPFELIIVDNGSTDGSDGFFESVGARVIRNDANYSYPHCQNQGIAAARHDWLAFLNNDVIVSPQWDGGLMESMRRNGLDVATACGIEQVENGSATRKLKRRWKRIGGLVGFLGRSKAGLRWMHRWMYGDWRAFCRDRRDRFSCRIKEGFVGNTVMMRRRALEKIGTWDESQQGADFDLYLRSKMRERDVGDMRAVHIALDVFVHHYIRLTLKGKHPLFADRDNFVSLSDKWAQDDLRYLEYLNK
jgi:GT2 family glycosyltransferase